MYTHPITTRHPHSPRLAWLPCLLTLFLGLLPCPGQVWGQNFVLNRCQQPTPDTPKLSCGYRLGEPDPKATLTALAGDRVLPLAQVSYPEANDTSAFLFLIDTSDPSRQAVVKKNVEQIREILKQRLPRHRFGLAVFNSRMEVLAPLGADDATLQSALDKVKAEGQTTEFYKNIQEAVKVAAGFNAKRRALVVISDGLAEDTAYTPKDVIDTALVTDVTIYGLGYAASAAKSTDLQRLQRLAEDTGGLYQAAAKDNTLPPDLVSHFYSYLENGGSITVDLSGLHGAQAITIRITDSKGQTMETKVDTILPELPPPPPWHSKHRTTLLLSALLCLLGLAAFFLLRLRRAQLRAAAQPAVLAILELLDDQGTRHDITTPVLRLGRNSGNDFRVGNDSVSGFHAELHRQRDGSFTITDLNSTNGVLVNGKKRHSCTLADSDIIELGDVRLRFHTVKEVGDEDLLDRS